MIFIGLGSNLSGEAFDSPRDVLNAALEEMSQYDITIIKISPFYETEPVPKSDQPWFLNAVVAVDTILSPPELLTVLHEIEANLGRERRIRWESRIIDLDIIAYGEQIYPTAVLWPEILQDIKSQDISPKELIIPHPRMHERLFVLEPLRDICPDWHHPILKKTIAELIKTIEKI